jgi:hypothetical protein
LRSGVAVAAPAAGVVMLPAVEASAKVPDDEGSRPAAVAPYDPAPPNFPEYDPRYELSRSTTSGSNAGSTDDAGVEALQTGASALAGAGVACGVMWLYRRRHAPAS